MNCLQLSSDTLMYFKLRLCYMSFLILSSIYCITILSLYDVLLPIPILMANAMSLFNSLLHVCDMLHYNRPFPQDGILLCMFDIMPNVLIIYSIVYYIIYISFRFPLVQVEFVLMIVYAVILGCSIILPFVGIILWYLGYCVSHLYEAI